jgi:hypothetical protein
MLFSHIFVIKRHFSQLTNMSKNVQATASFLTFSAPVPLKQSNWVFGMVPFVLGGDLIASHETVPLIICYNSSLYLLITRFRLHANFAYRLLTTTLIYFLSYAHFQRFAKDTSWISVVFTVLQ